MTNLTPEQIREAVELAEGMEIRPWHDNGISIIIWDDEYGESSVICSDTFDTAPKWFIAALASQLISQVEAIDTNIRVQCDRGFTAIRRCKTFRDGVTPTKWKDVAAAYGPNRDDNSILACTEFLRGR